MIGGVLSGLATAPGGRIVAAGQSIAPNRVDDEFTAVRYNEDGSLDTTFDGDGKVFLDLGGAPFQFRYDRAYAVAVDPADGGVFLAGTSNLVGEGPVDVHSAMVRLTSSGALDTGFAGDGIDLSRRSQFNAMALLPTGLVIAAGEAPDAGPFGSTDVLLARYGRSGRDVTFGDSDFAAGTAGTTTVDVRGPVRNLGRAVAVQDDGKVVVGGETESGNDRSTDFGLARFNADGTPDTTFGGTGYVVSDFSHQQDWLNALAVQADGRIVASGYRTGADGSDDVLVVRYLPDGTLDPSFGSGTGKAVVEAVEGVGVFGTSMALQPDGKIVVAGGLDSGDVNTFVVVRFDPSGAPDASFGGGDGVVVTHVAGAGDYLFGRAVAVDGAGRIIVAGGTSAVAVVRFDPAGNADPSFDGDGIAVTQFSPAAGAAAFASALGVDASDRVVVAGPTHVGTQPTDFGVARFTDGGTLDPSFGAGGRVVTDFAGSRDDPNALAVLPGGAVVVAGSTLRGPVLPSSQAALDFALAMYTPGGAPDPAFGDGGKVTSDFGGPDEVYGLALDGADRVVAGGISNGDFAAARYTLNPAAAPRVRQASVSGSAWQPAFRNHLRDAGLSVNQSGFPVGPAAGGPLPWINLDQVAVTFDQQVQVGANDLRVRGAGGAEYALDAAAFTYDAATRTATWRLANGAVFGPDRVRLELDGDSVRGGGRQLDGDGDGAAGGDFAARFNVLPGDVNGDGTVLADDFSGVRKKFFSSPTSALTGDRAYSAPYDVDGSGFILANDFSEVKKRFFDALPPDDSGATPRALSRVADGVL
jgi:uncharacterized delta-60 repeat protein